MAAVPHVDTLYYDGHYRYGYGEFVWDLYPLSDGWYPIRVWEHGGNTPSFTSVLVMLPDRDTVISILSNGYSDLWPATTEAVIRAVVGSLPPVSSYPGPTVDLDDLATHVGHYEDPWNTGPMDISIGGTYGLQISMPLVEQYGYDVSLDLIPLSTDTWYVDISGMYLDLTFLRDPAGGQDAYVRNRIFVAMRPDLVPGGEGTDTDTGAVSAGRIAPPTREQVERALAAAAAPSPIRRIAPR